MLTNTGKERRVLGEAEIEAALKELLGLVYMAESELKITMLQILTLPLSAKTSIQ